MSRYEKQVDSYYFRLWENIYDLDGNEATYYRLFNNIGDGRTDIYLCENFNITKQELLDNVIKKLSGSVDLSKFNCTENIYGWVFTAYVYQDESNDVLEYVDCGNHNVVEEYTVQVLEVIERNVEVSKLT